MSSDVSEVSVQADVSSRGLAELRWRCGFDVYFLSSGSRVTVPDRLRGSGADECGKVSSDHLRRGPRALDSEARACREKREWMRFYVNKKQDFRGVRLSAHLGTRPSTKAG